MTLAVTQQGLSRPSEYGRHCGAGTCTRSLQVGSALRGVAHRCSANADVSLVGQEVRGIEGIIDDTLQSDLHMHGC